VQRRWHRSGWAKLSEACVRKTDLSSFQIVLAYHIKPTDSENVAANFMLCKMMMTQRTGDITSRETQTCSDIDVTYVFNICSDIGSKNKNTTAVCK